MIRNTTKRQKMGWVLFILYLCLLAYFMFFSESFGRTDTFGFTWSLILETLQLISKVGSFDVDDLFLNTLGAAFGFGCYCLVQHMRLRYRRKIH